MSARDVHILHCKSIDLVHNSTFHNFQQNAFDHPISKNHKFAVVYRTSTEEFMSS